jgi:putative component of toxin-antitoxin plasmid stabilization module
MTITNEDRYALQERATSVLGREHATTMMELLPPVGWAEVATQSDLDAQTEAMSLKWRLELAGAEKGIRGDMASMEKGIRGDMASMEKAISDLQISLEAGLRKFQNRMVVIIVSLVGVLAAIAGAMAAFLT